jgi:hypothetical protein
VANAAALAQKLMDKYGITLAEVEMSGNKSMDMKFHAQPATTSINGIESWHWSLARAIGRITQTKHYSSSKYSEAKRAGVAHTVGRFYKTTGKTRQHQLYKTICFYGTPSAVEIATMLFDRWVVVIRKMALEATREYTQELEQQLREELGREDIHLHGWGGKLYKQLGVELEDTPRAFLNGWLLGCTTAIDNKLYEAEKARTTETTKAIVLVQDKLTVAYEQFSEGFQRVKSRGGSTTNWGGFAKGSKVGSEINIGAKELEG